MLRPGSLALRATYVLLGVALFGCTSSSSGSMSGGGGGGGGSDCFPDNDGINGGSYTLDLAVDDTGFSKTVIATQNDSQATVTLTNMGTKPHGFAVGCTSAAPSYPNEPAGCPTTVCFPTNATIAPLAPGASAIITFDTPVPDNLIYPFTSTAADDATVPGLNDGQWTLM